MKGNRIIKYSILAAVGTVLLFAVFISGPELSSSLASAAWYPPPFYTSSLPDPYDGSKAQIVLGYDHATTNHWSAIGKYAAPKGLPGSLYIVTSKVGAAGGYTMSWNQLNYLAENGYEAASHSRTHARIDMLNETQLTSEIIGSKDDLTDMGYCTTGFVPPNNVMPNDVIYSHVKDNYSYLMRIGHPNTMKSLENDNNNFGMPVLRATPAGNTGLIFDIASAKTYIDNAIANNQLLIINFHQIEDKPANPLSTPIKVYAFITEYLKTQRDAGKLDVTTQAAALGAVC